ncbi:MAG: helix-turn-helix transcriptional regulator [bacterium]
MTKVLNQIEIGTMIKTARKRKRLTQKELAEKVGCTLAHIGRIEIGAAHPSIKLLGELQGVLDTIIFDLFPFFEEEDKQTLFSRLLHELPKLKKAKLKTVVDLVVLMTKEDHD